MNTSGVRKGNPVLNELQSAIRLAARGAAHELIEQYNIPQPKADTLVLWAIFNELDNQADIPALLFAPVCDAIRIAVENEHADAYMDAEEQMAKSALDYDLSKAGAS